MRLDDILRNQETAPSEKEVATPDSDRSKGEGFHEGGSEPESQAVLPATPAESGGVVPAGVESVNVGPMSGWLTGEQTAEIDETFVEEQRVEEQNAVQAQNNIKGHNKAEEENYRQAHPSQATVSKLPMDWHYTRPVYRKRALWSELPTVNRVLALCGFFFLSLCVLRIGGPPVIATAEEAYRPYTPEGKQELCLTHMKSVATALLAYANDFDGRYPPLDYQNSPSQRVTWVSALKPYLSADSLLCPVGPDLPAASQGVTSSYVINPVLASVTKADVDDAAATILTGDGGSKHDVSLLPPYPSWPSFSMRSANGQSTNSQINVAGCNFGLRHGSGFSANTIYADGHAGNLGEGTDMTDSALWGGSAVLRASRDRLAGGNAQAREMMARLKAGNVQSAASYLKANGKSLKSFSSDFVSLWRLNTGEHTSDSVEELGWSLAAVWHLVGDNSYLTQLNEEQTRRSQTALQIINNRSWEQRQVSGQPTIRCQAPSLWTFENQQEGRYRRLYLRSSLPSAYALLEVGSRTKYVNPQPINWDGEDKELRGHYKSNYLLLNRNSVTLNGQTASVWEYEIEKPSMPRLRKRLVGYTDGWNSYVISASSPAKDWVLWRPVFEKLLSSVQTGYPGDR